MIYVLDTNIAAAALNLHPAVTSRLAQLVPSDVGFSLIVVGELLYGARKSQRVAENLARVEALRARFPVLPISDAVMERYAVVRAGLGKLGRPKGDFDLLIAATAVEHSAVLVTNDAGLKDGTIDGLTVEDWLA
ncbi:MAG: PIN domain-containing protein [Polyangiaceae bacterium]|nr:PIN domain-containing protein [Polyangiaceae bacterium]MCE7890497.1 type II toxin-antitoxin system VapC family toxin [Sorangiineae bacterium PRO1]MCL4756436.1 PIN domain-containing protein [Myxococcales bacterium]